MKIEKVVLNKLNDSILEIPPETGGILGSHNDDIIDEVVIDLPDPTNVRPCHYFPNVDFFNCTIELWQREGISFKGIFHTHFAGVKTLSCGDKQYISTIMNSMPPYIDHLYFPVYVLPDRKFVCYKAIRVENGMIDIYEEDLVVE